MNPYTDPGHLAKIIRQYDLKMSKGMGQNFLIDSSVPAEIVEKSGIGQRDCVIEIGPGVGALTRELAACAAKVTAIELDEKLLPVLEQSLAPFGNVTVVCADAMQVDLDAIILEDMGAEKAKLCANLPYSVATGILTTVLEKSARVSELTVMVQKEVAHRICASPGSKEYGALSVVCDYYCTRQLLFDVGPQCFMPRPKIVSSVLKLTRRKVPACAVEAQRLFPFVRLAFSLRRKTLKNALSASGKYDKEKVGKALISLGLREDARAEMLSTGKLADLLERLER